MRTVLRGKGKVQTEIEQPQAELKGLPGIPINPKPRGGGLTPRGGGGDFAARGGPCWAEGKYVSSLCNKGEETKSKTTPGISVAKPRFRELGDAVGEGTSTSAGGCFVDYSDLKKQRRKSPELL